MESMSPADILIVEDSPTQAEELQYILEKHGYCVFAAHNGREALDMLATKKPILVISDIVMPEMDGFELCRRIKGSDSLKEIPVILLTALSDPEDVLRGLECGADNFIIKPYDESYLIARVHHMLINTELRKDSKLQIGVELLFKGQKYFITSERQQILDLLMSTYETAVMKNCELLDARKKLEELNEQLEKKVEERTATLFAEIEERKKAELELRKLSQQFSALLDNLPDGIVHIAPDFGVIWANRSMAEQLKTDKDQFEGSHCYESFWNFRQPCVSCPVDRSFHTREFEEGNMSMPDGRLLELRAVPISDESGRVESVIEVIRDITEHNKIEEQLRQAQKMESIGTLAGGIAHDFNNILTAIIGFGHIALLQMGPDDPLRENIEHMLEGGDRAAQLTKGLLTFSRKEISVKRPVELNEIIRKVEKFLVRVIGEDIKFSMALHSEPIVVHADPHQLEQVLINLATNARDAMTEGGDIIISTETIHFDDEFVAIHGYGKFGRYALMTISDTGKGMDEETSRKIFDPFFTTKEVGKGTGLGLAVVYGIIRQHEGFINVYSEPGSGTSFRIYLPLISTESCAEKIPAMEATLARGTETVLLAEDDESVRNLIGIALKQEGYTVIEAVDGADAVKIFMENSERIDLILSDLIMPRMDGKAAYDQMKVLRPELKALFVSGYAPDLVRQKLGLESNVAVISKPVLPHALLQKVRNLLDEGEI